MFKNTKWYFEYLWWISKFTKSKSFNSLTKTRRVWLDTDGSSHDIINLSLLLSEPQTYVVGVSANGNGHTNMKSNLKWIMRMRKVFKKNFPIVEGVSKSTFLNNKFPSQISDFANKNYNVNFEKHFNKNEYFKNDEMVKVLRKINKNFDLIILGNASNWTKVIEVYPEIIEKINNVYIYGGVILKEDEPLVGIKGNIDNSLYANEVSEWNFFIDSAAIQKLFFFFKDRITLFPINLINDKFFPSNLFNKLKDIKTYSAQIYKTLLDNLLAVKNPNYNAIASEVVITSYLASKPLVRTKRYGANVLVTDDLSQNGKLTLFENNNNNIKVATFIEYDDLINSFFELINK